MIFVMNFALALLHIDESNTLRGKRKHFKHLNMLLTSRVLEIKECFNSFLMDGQMFENINCLSICSDF